MASLWPKKELQEEIENNSQFGQWLERRMEINTIYDILFSSLHMDIFQDNKNNNFIAKGRVWYQLENHKYKHKWELRILKNWVEKCYLYIYVCDEKYLHFRSPFGEHLLH